MTVIADQLIDIGMFSDVTWFIASVGSFTHSICLFSIASRYIASVCVEFIRWKPFYGSHWPSGFLLIIVIFIIEFRFENSRAIYVGLLVYWLSEVTHFNHHLIFITFPLLWSSSQIFLFWTRLGISWLHIVFVLRINIVNLVNHWVNFSSLLDLLLQFVVKETSEETEQSQKNER